MFITEMEYWFHGMHIEEEDDYVIRREKAQTLEEAEKIASDFASEAERRLNEVGAVWGYDYPGISFDGLGRRFALSGDGLNYDIYIRLE